VILNTVPAVCAAAFCRAEEVSVGVGNYFGLGTVTIAQLGKEHEARTEASLRLGPVLDKFEHLSRIERFFPELRALRLPAPERLSERLVGP
jgi:hypothetical protein